MQIKWIQNWISATSALLGFLFNDRNRTRDCRGYHRNWVYFALKENRDLTDKNVRVRIWQKLNDSNKLICAQTLLLYWISQSYESWSIFQVHSRPQRVWAIRWTKKVLLNWWPPFLVIESKNCFSFSNWSGCSALKASHFLPYRRAKTEFQSGIRGPWFKFLQAYLDYRKTHI